MHKVYLEDSRSMTEVTDLVANLVVFDPPLWNHVNYSSTEGQLGNLTDYRQYLAGITQVANECVRVLQEGGMLVTVVPDVLLMQDGQTIDTVSFHSDIATVLRSCGLKLISSRVVLIGDEKQRDYIPTDDNPFRTREDFRTTRWMIAQIFCKGEIPKYLQVRAVDDYWGNPIRFGSQSVILGSKWLYRLMTRLLNWKWLWALKQKIRPKKQSGLNLLDYPVRASTEMFEWLISRWSRAGDLVVDPFLGTGTTLAVCQKTGRQCIGYEINPSARDVIQKSLPNKSDVAFINR